MRVRRQGRSPDDASSQRSPNDTLRGPGVRVLPPDYARNLAMPRPSMHHSNSRRDPSAPLLGARAAEPVGPKPKTPLPPRSHRDNDSVRTSSRAACREAKPRRQRRFDRRRSRAIAISYSARSPPRDRRPRQRETGRPTGRVYPCADTARARCRRHRIALAVNDRHPSPPPSRGPVPGHLVIAHRRGIAKLGNFPTHPIGLDEALDWVLAPPSLQAFDFR